jgi:hypothetical protein
VTFLALGPALIAAALAVPLLLALYVLKLRRRPLRASTTAFWQVASADAQANVPFQRLRASWMLALHLALLACLLLAFARPVLRDGAGSGAASRTVLLIDTSASMGARDALDGQPTTADTPTRLDRAKQRAKELVRESRRAARAPEIAVVALGAQSELVLGFSTSVPLLEAAIDGIAQTDQPGDLMSALRLVQSLAAETQALEQPVDPSSDQASGQPSPTTPAGNAPPQRGIASVLLSDGSFASSPTDASQSLVPDALAPAPAPPTDEGGTEGGPAGAPQTQAQSMRTARDTLARLALRYERVGPPLVARAGAASPTVPARVGTASRNVGITRIAALRDASTPTRVRLLLALASNAPEETPLTLTVALDGNVVQRVAAIVPAAVVASEGAETPSAAAGQAGDEAPLSEPAAAATPAKAKPDALGTRELVLDVPSVEQGLLTVVVDTGSSPDGLMSDNAASVVMLPTRTPSVLLLRSDDAASSAGALRYLLPDVLEELRFARLEQRVIAGDAQAREAEVASLLQSSPWADVAILDDLSLPIAPPMPAIVLGGDAPPLGIVRVGQPRPWSGLVFWDRQHPLLQGVGFDSLVLGKRLPLALGGAPGSESQSATSPTRPTSLTSSPGPWRHDVLVRDGDEPLIILAQPRGIADGAGARHLVSAFALRESNWPLSPSFAIFLANTTDSLALRDAARVGKSLSPWAGGQVRVPGVGEVRLVGPVSRTLRSDDARDASSTASGEGDAAANPATNPTTNPASVAPVVLATGILPRAGLYRVEAAQTASDIVERVVAVNVVSEHETALASPRELSIDNRPLPTTPALAGERELWPTFLLLALLLLTAEWVLFARQTRA